MVYTDMKYTCARYSLKHCDHLRMKKKSNLRITALLTSINLPGTESPCMREFQKFVKILHYPLFIAILFIHLKCMGKLERG